MTATRDARGRFANPDVAAAERVLQAACAEAVRLLRRRGWRTATPRLGFDVAAVWSPGWESDVEDVLHAAGYAASLLLDRRAS